MQAEDVSEKVREFDKVRDYVKAIDRRYYETSEEVRENNQKVQELIQNIHIY